MKVVFVVEGGTDVRLVEELDRRYDLALIGRPTSPRGFVSQPLSSPVATATGPASRLKFALFAARQIAGTDADVVLVQGYGVAALFVNLVGRLRRRGVAMLVCSPAEAYYASRRSSPGDPRFRHSGMLAIRAAARANALLAQHYVVLSDHLGDVIRGHRTRAPIRRIPVYGVDTERFAPDGEDPAALRRRRDLPGSGRLIFYSSRVAPEKDAETLLEAFGALVREGRDVWLVNRSGGHREFRELAERHGLVERVITTDASDPREGLVADYRAADVCVQASRAEGLGFSVLEALSCETPVVAAAVGGLRETIRDGETGYTYTPGDAASLAASLRAALDDPAEARRRARAGRKMVEDGYAVPVVFDELDRLLRSAAARDRRSSRR